MNKLRLSGFLGWLYLKHFIGCHDVLILGKSPIKRQRPLMTITVDRDVKHQSNKQMNKLRWHTILITCFQTTYDPTELKIVSHDCYGNTQKKSILV